MLVTWLTSPAAHRPACNPWQIVFLGVFLLTKSTARSGPSAAELAAAEKMRLVYATFEDEAVPSRRTTFDTIKALRMEEEEAEQEEAPKQTGGQVVSTAVGPSCPCGRPCSEQQGGARQLLHVLQ